MSKLKQTQTEKCNFIDIETYIFCNSFLVGYTLTPKLRPSSPSEQFQWVSYRTVCFMKRSGSWAVKVVRRDPAGRPSSSLMDFGLGLNSGLSLMSRILTETVAVDWRGRWMPRANATSFSASTVSMKERLNSKSIGCTEESREDRAETWLIVTTQLITR